LATFRESQLPVLSQFQYTILFRKVIRRSHPLIISQKVFEQDKVGHSLNQAETSRHHLKEHLNQKWYEY